MHINFMEISDFFFVKLFFVANYFVLRSNYDTL